MRTDGANKGNVHRLTNSDVAERIGLHPESGSHMDDTAGEHHGTTTASKAARRGAIDLANVPEHLF